MPVLTIYHNPRCSKSRNALAILQDNQSKDGNVNYELDIIKYQDVPPSPETLQQLAEYLGLTNEDAAHKPWNYLLRPDAQRRAGSWEEAFALIQAEPATLERPFVIDWDSRKATLGRPDLSGVEKLVAQRTL
ncbi:hypothetical protein DFQ28_006860 [Apophysomyces sp. BC1034]|nr:hypothetical protein DFQ30_006786 [Apophysomyces sp. BC1015]KAG0176726.1 hypothetical protein DFQ29_005708 [Apophysomyces sp. BC1021]KAG0187096.1 hypothetical protein DFQ28_006860 [Apophysomyces sp. BC1034]